MAKTKDIRQAVEAELAADPHVESGGIAVMTASGDVALSGSVPGYPQYLEAVQATWRVPGVTSVRNHLRVQLPPENRRDDARLTTDANNALAASSAGLEQVEAVAKNGDLTLTGLVKFRRQRAAAEVAVSGLAGVRNVKNEIEIGFDVDPAEVNRLVRQALDRHQVLPDDSDVAADITGSTVVLAGHVQDRAQRDAAVAAAWLAHGVMVVVDEIEVAG